MSAYELSAVQAKAANKEIATEDTTEANTRSSKSIVSSKHTKRRLAANAPPAKVRKRAVRACKHCRARKVRCDVTHGGSPCRNCRWDNLECSTQETRRQTVTNLHGAAEDRKSRGASMGSFNGLSVNNAPKEAATAREAIEHVLSDMDYPHSLVNFSLHLSSSVTRLGTDHRSTPLLFNLISQASPFGDLISGQSPSSLKEPNLYGQLPAFFQPLPTNVAAEDVGYLRSKGALSVPSVPLQNALLQAYVEYVHPYMPLELFPFLNAINAGDGRAGKVSLLMYQAVMFAATAFVDKVALLEAGYATRKAARKAFFQKTRLLHDFDCEPNQLVVVQALLLMTYWYETSEDQKGAWHWIGVAISLAYTMGLHQDPRTTSMSTARQKLRKRIWWSCFIRDRLIALGLRQPSRIHDGDFNVAMLEEGDFEIEVFPEDNNIFPRKCTILGICIGQVLHSMYSVDIRNNSPPENIINSIQMLFPNKKPDNMECFLSINLELVAWAEALPPCCRYTPLMPLDIKDGNATIAVQRTLLHMLYYTIDLTLHRPQLLSPSPIHAMTTPSVVQAISRLHIRDATIHVTHMASELHHLRLDRFLPITGVTVILPTMMIQLLEMRDPAPQARDLAARGFQQCLCVMEKLREIYVAADDTVGFLDAALRKLDVDINELAATAVLLAELDLDSTNGGPTSLVVAESKEISFPDLTFSLEQEVFDWNAVTGIELDLDQWLQFPPEETQQQ
ncbi:N-terminal binuclear Zn cluster-containing protein [Fusarium oxysporum]|nr:N-terminal binuclear Zn cluster-containing protein [Fusarium oxysporum]